MQATYLAHHGVKGMKWGVRRFQKDDGSLTLAGKKRYGDSSNGDKKQQRARDKEIYGYVHKDRMNVNRDFYAQKQHGGMGRHSGANRRYALRRSMNEAKEKYGKDAEEAYAREAARRRRNAAIGMAAVAGVALAVVGAKTYHDYIRGQNAEYHRQRGELLVAAYKEKNVYREFRRQQDMEEYGDVPTNARRVAQFARTHDAKLEDKVSDRIRGYEARQSKKDTFKQARKNVSALKTGMSSDSFEYKRNYGTNRESYNNYVRGERLALAKRARDEIKKRGKLGPGGRYSPKKTSRGKSYLRSDQVLKNLKANGIDPKRMGLM